MYTIIIGLIFICSHSVTFSPVKWTFKSETYQIVKREKLVLADRDEIINEDLQDLSAHMQAKVKEELAKNNDVYVMVAQFEEECVQMRYVQDLTGFDLFP
jgi:hypothetical protein